jgi:hypothetical protein
MELFLIGVAWVLVWLAITTVKDLDAKAEERSNERIMADYLQAEAVRYHAENLAAIDRAVRATAEEMVRTAAEARGEIIESTAIEIKR